MARLSAPVLTSAVAVTPGPRVAADAVGSVVPVLLTAHDRPVQTGCGNVTAGPVLPAGSGDVVTSRVTGVPARPHASLTVRVTV